MKQVYIFGHKNPDTDSILSAFLYAKFLKNKGWDPIVSKLGTINNETKYLLKKFNLDEPQTITTLEPGTKIALVDHNEPKQTIDNFNELEIIGLVDHHPFGNFTTSTALDIRTEPLCTCGSIFYKLYNEQGLEIDQKTAQIMIATIISDSLYFRSPTTTNEDKQICNELNKIAQIADLEEFSMEMFNAKSDLGDISAIDLIQYDYKEFDFNGTKAGIGTLETTNPAYGLGRKDEILSGMTKIKQESGLDIIMLCVVDIINEKNITIVLGEEEAKLIKEVYGADTIDNLVDLGNLLSRKKQILPKFTEYYNK